LLTGGERHWNCSFAADAIQVDFSGALSVWSLTSGTVLQKMAFEFEGPITAVRWITLHALDNAQGVAGFAVGTAGGFLILSIAVKERVIFAICHYAHLVLPTDDP
jgi:hypothetical protein